MADAPLTREAVIALVRDALLRLLAPDLQRGWVWKPGMVAVPSSHPAERWLLCWVEGDSAGAYKLDNSGKTWGLHDDDPICLSEGWVPDLSDPGTAGILAAQEVIRG